MPTAAQRKAAREAEQIARDLKAQAIRDHIAKLTPAVAQQKLLAIASAVDAYENFSAADLLDSIRRILSA